MKQDVLEPFIAPVQQGAVQAASSSNFSLFGLFASADPVTQIVMGGGLIIVSIWSWAIIVSNLLCVRRLNMLAQTFEEAFWSGGSLDTLYYYYY